VVNAAQVKTVSLAPKSWHHLSRTFLNLLGSLGLERSRRGAELANHPQKVGGYTLEEVKGATDALKISWEIFRRPLAFQRYHDPDRLPEARGYVIAGLVLLMATFFVIGLLSGHKLVDSEITSSVGAASSDVNIHLDPNAFEIDSALLITGVLLGATIVGRLIHVMLARLSHRKVSHQLATMACLYWLGFACVVFSTFILGSYALILIGGAGQHQSLMLFLILFVVVCLWMYAICALTIQLFEWPRRLYGFRARIFYPVLFVGLFLISAVGKLIFAPNTPWIQ
jgi:hypothetical protein